MPSPDRDYHGRISYRGADGEQGRETFSVTVRDFGRTVRSYCEIDEERLVRDASWTMDRDWRPLEGHVRVTLGDALAGSSWYRFDADGVECEGMTAGFGRVSQRLKGGFAYLGLHPLVGDGLVAAARGCDEPGVERSIASVTCSYSENGETNLVALPIAIAVTFVGEEQIEVPAGRFAARHFRIRWQPHWPPADLWVHGDDYIFLRLSWAVSQTTSELTALTMTGPAGAKQEGVRTRP